MPIRKKFRDIRVSRSPYFPLLHLLCDSIALAVAWEVTRDTRLFLNPYMALSLSPRVLDDAAPPLVALLLLWLLTATGRNIYSAKKETLLDGVLRVAESAVVVSSIALILTFFSRQLGADLSRSFILLFVPISFACLMASFCAAMTAACRIDRWLPGRKRTAILGFGYMADEVVEAMSISSERGATLRGMILPAQFAVAGFASRAADLSSTSLPVLGTTSELAEVINRESLDRIIVACDTLTDPEEEFCGEVMRRMGVTVSRRIPTGIVDVHVSYQNQFGMHFVDLQAPPFTAWQEVLKRGIDTVVSLTLILMLMPLLLVIAALIKLTSKGPIFYRAPRVGKGGRYFSFWKFRTMRCDGPSRRDLAKDNEHADHIFKMRRDPRITPVGRILRRFSLDELAQLFNVLAGDMSLIGPRPLPAEDLDPDGMSRKFRAWAEQRARVRPGISGLWQIRGRSDVPFDEMMELDIQYIREWSLKLDVEILLATPMAVISGRGAY